MHDDDLLFREGRHVLHEEIARTHHAAPATTACA